MKVGRRPAFLSCSVGSCTHDLYLHSCILLEPKHEIVRPSNEATGIASRCPFLTAEKNRVVKEASMELQEDVQELESRSKGKTAAHAYRTWPEAECKSCTIRLFLLVGDLIETKKPKTGVPHLLKDNLRNGDSQIPPH